MRLLILVIVLSILCGIGWGQAAPATAPAAQTRSLSLSPAVVMTSGQPGQSFTQTLTLHNQTGMTFNFEMVAQDVVVRDGKRVFVGAGEVERSIAATAVFSRRLVQVEPNQRASVDLTVTLPAGTPLRAMVAIFKGTDKITGGSNALGMTASLGTLITFTTSQNFDLRPEAMQVLPQSDSQALTVTQPLVNAGAEPVIAEGVLAILAPSGALVGKVKFPAQRLLPGEQVPFETEYPSLLPAGHYRALASFQFDSKSITNSSEFDVR